MQHDSYCITCLIKLLCLIFCVSIAVMLVYFAIYKSGIDLRRRQSVRMKSPSMRSINGRKHKRELSKSVLVLSLLAVLFYCISLTALLIGDIYIDSIYWFGCEYGMHC